jgi:hypothetical protein
MIKIIVQMKSLVSPGYNASDENDTVRIQQGVTL